MKQGSPDVTSGILSDGAAINYVVTRVFIFYSMFHPERDTFREVFLVQQTWKWNGKVWRARSDVTSEVTSLDPGTGE